MREVPTASEAPYPKVGGLTCVVVRSWNRLIERAFRWTCSAWMR